MSINKLQPMDLNCNVFSVYDYDSGSMNELLCKFFEKINNCIDVSNATFDLAKWLVNEGLNQEVVKQLMTWLHDGTLQQIINENIFKDLNDKINNVNTDLSGKITSLDTKLTNKIGNIVTADTSDFDNIQAAHDYVVSKGGGVLNVSKDETITNTFNWDVRKVIINGNGKKLMYMNADPNSYAIRTTSSEETPHPYNQSPIEMKNLKIDLGGSKGILFVGDGNGKEISHIGLHRCEIAHGGIALTFGNNSYMVTFYACDIYDCEQIMFMDEGVVNTGENINFLSCCLYNNRSGFKILTGNSDVFITNTSIDYNVFGSVIETVGRFFIDNCHIEHGLHQFNNGVVPFVVKGDSGFLSINNSFILFDQNHPTTVPNIFYTERDMCKINVSNTWLFGLKTTSRWLCGGTGKLVMKNNQMNIVPVNDLRISPNNTQSCIGTMTASELIDIFITNDTNSANVGNVTGDNINISYDNQITYKFGKSIKVSKVGGGGSAAAFAHVIPIDRMSINNLELMIKINGGSGRVFYNMGYCSIDGRKMVKDNRATIDKTYSGNTDWESVEWYLKDAPPWATHMFVDVNMDNANQLNLYIGEISGNSF